MADTPQTSSAAKPQDSGQGGSMLDDIIASRSFPFVAPFALFMLMLFMEDEDTGSKYYIYPLKALLVGLLILWIWKRLPKIEIKTWLGSIAIGVVGFVVWVGLEPWLVWSHDAHDGGFNAYKYAEANGYGLNVVYALLAIRIFSAAVVVPIAEELFWRGFLMRFLINPNGKKIPRPDAKAPVLDWLDYDLDRYTYDDWWKNPLGQYRPVSFWATAFIFSMVHGDFWILAIIYAVLVGWLFCRTKSLGDAILAHGVTNLLLGFYVLYTQQWWWW